MLDAIAKILQGIAEFLGLFSHPEMKKVEDVLPEKSESEKALDELTAEEVPSPAPKSGS